MRVKNIVAFVAAVAVSLAAAVHRFKDSGHAAGLLGADGGKVRHAVQLDPGKRQYVVAVTATVLPPYRGNARVAVEGEPKMDYEVRFAGPAADLGIRRGPRLADGVIEGLRPKDKFALWIVLRPKDQACCPACCSEGGAEEPECCSEGGSGKEGGPGEEVPPAGNTVAFYDTETGKPLLRIPVTFRSGKETRHAEQD